MHGNLQINVSPTSAMSPIAQQELNEEEKVDMYKSYKMEPFACYTKDHLQGWWIHPSKWSRHPRS